MLQMATAVKADIYKRWMMGCSENCTRTNCCHIDQHIKGVTYVHSKDMTLNAQIGDFNALGFDPQPDLCQGAGASTATALD